MCCLVFCFVNNVISSAMFLPIYFWFLASLLRFNNKMHTLNLDWDCNSAKMTKHLFVGSVSLTLFLFPFPQCLTDCINDSHTVPHPSTHSCFHDAAGLAFCLPGLSRALRDHCWTPVPVEEVGGLLCICLCLFLLNVDFVFLEDP